MREFAYYADGRVAVLVAGLWHEYLGLGLLGNTLVEDDGLRGWRLSRRLAIICAA